MRHILYMAVGLKLCMLYCIPQRILILPQELHNYNIYCFIALSLQWLHNWLCSSTRSSLPSLTARFTCYGVESALSECQETTDQCSSTKIITVQCRVRENYLDMMSRPHLALIAGHCNGVDSFLTCFGDVFSPSGSNRNNIVNIQVPWRLKYTSN